MLHSTTPLRADQLTECERQSARETKLRSGVPARCPAGMHSSSTCRIRHFSPGDGV
ncbi:hypothetical protein ACFPRL_35960 [Pseudoclavibacter helvolus]